MIVIGPPLDVLPKIVPGSIPLSSSLSKFTINTADPAHKFVAPIPAPITATYLSFLESVLLPMSSEGILNILGADQVSPN